MFEIGSSLRDARLRKGLDLADLEVQTKIRAKYLRALEEERFEQLPGDTYVKGFLRTYADTLGLDGQLYVDEYNSRFSLAEEPVLAARPRRRSSHGRFEANAVIVALAGIIAVTVLVIAAWQLGTGSDDERPRPATTAATMTGVEEPAAPSAEPPSVQLVLTARTGSTRVEVRRGSAQGELLWEGTLTRGHDQMVEGDRLWMRIGKAQNVSLTLNGEPVAPLGRGERLLVVTESGLRPAGE